MTPGGEVAGIGIDVTSLGWASQENIFRNLYIRDITGGQGLGYGIRIGPPPAEDWQTSEMIFQDIYIGYVTTGVYQEGNQTANVFWERVQVAPFKTYGMEFVRGMVRTEGCVLIPYVNYGDPQADIYVHSTAQSAIFQNNDHEDRFGTNLVSYRFEPGLRSDPTLFLNNSILWFKNAGNIIDYQQHGPVTFIGNTFHLDNPSADSGVININPAPPGSPVHVISHGNLFQSGPQPGTCDGNVCNVHMTIGGFATLESNDDPRRVGDSWTSNGAHDFYRAGLVFEGGSFNWKNIGGSITFRQALTGDLLRMLDGNLPEPNTFAWWTNTGTLRLANPNSGLEFGIEGGPFTRIIPSASQSGISTITLPARTGTALVSGDRLTGAVSATLDANGLTATTLSSGVVKPSTLSVGGSSPTDGYTVTKTNGSDEFTWTPLVLASFGFSGVGPTNNNTKYFGPNSGLSGTMYTTVGAPVPALRVTTLICRTDATLSGTPPKSWTIALQKGASAAGIGPCVLDSSHNPCSVTGAAASYAANDVLSIKVTASNSPNPGNVICTAIATN